MKQGQARLRFLGVPVYDIEMWAPNRVESDQFERQPFALAITYLRPLSGRRIAERSIAEMRRAGPIPERQEASWLAQMLALFPDVGNGDRITGIHRPPETAQFHVNGNPAGQVAGAGFSSHFFGIWLAPWTSEPTLRQALIGMPR